jgi:hypothetical protein
METVLTNLLITRIKETVLVLLIYDFLINEKRYVVIGISFVYVEYAS